MRSENQADQAAHELDVIDAVVRGGGHARPEDAALTDFALLVRNARPVPDHGAAMRLDERVKSAQTVQKSNRRPLAAALATFALALLVGGATLNSQRDARDLRSTAVSGSTSVEAVPRDSGTVQDPGVQKSLAQDSSNQAKLATQESAPATIGSRADVAEDRRVARDARLTLATPGAKVERLSDEVVATVDAARGYVADSSVSTGQGGRGRATFRLMLSAATFQQTFSDLSKLAHVRSRSQSTEDITADYNSAQRGIQLWEGRVIRLEEKLKQAGTAAQKAALTRQLVNAKAALRNAEARNRANLARVKYVPVDLKIVADSTAATADQGTIGKAFSKAREILTNVLAALIVILAVLLPLALVAALATLGYRRFNRTRSDRTIGEAAAQPE